MAAYRDKSDNEEMSLWQNVRKLWDAANQIKAKSKANKKNYVISFCSKESSSDAPIYSEQYIFPSKIIKKIALDMFDKIDDVFTAKELFAKISDAYDKIGSEQYDEVSFLICDILLFKAYMLLKDYTSRTFDSIEKQLNICIILDAMRIFPDNVENSATILREINKKAEMNAGLLHVNAVWAIAMLNYKMHDYERTLTFLNQYMYMSAEASDDDTRKRRVRARIYTGYCYEKLTSKPDMLPAKKEQSFGDAIETFQNLLQEIDNTPENRDVITELHHGLGHFYNERAVFSCSPNPQIDLQKAREHMWIALKNSKDYYSCFGSLYHEYGDYECANCLFEEAMRQDEIVNNEELKNEMKFYLAQTGAALSVEDQADNNFTEFENYCRSTYNYDGIVHARIFKIRTFLRKTTFIPNLGDRGNIREQLNTYLEELIEYPLSNYASQSIKDEYEKTLLILNVFRTFYANQTFRWNEGDLIYYLNSFISMMPESVCEAHHQAKTGSKSTTRLYKININKIPIWCVGGEDLVDVLTEQSLKKQLLSNGITLDKPVPISGRDAERVRNLIRSNKIPDLIMLIQPLKEDKEFEDEISLIAYGANELYFVISNYRLSPYNHKWLENQAENAQLQIYQSDTLLNVFRRAYCIRCLEILRKELLRPIPLFSLAPTHFSASYNFQLGEAIDLQTMVMQENKQDQLVAQLKYVDEKYLTDVDRRISVEIAYKAFSIFDQLNCAPGIFTICFPSPAFAARNDACYVSYRVQDVTLFPQGKIAHKIASNIIYTKKVLPAYSRLYNNLRKALANNENCDKSNGKTTCSYHFKQQDEIEDECKQLLKNVIEFTDLDKQNINYNCILWHNGYQEEYIYCVLSKPGDGTPYCKLHNSVRNQEKPSVFISYSNEPEESPTFDDYMKEVVSFASLLQKNGYSVFLDRASSDRNWDDVMLEGFTKDKVIVLLSPEYKRKAERCPDTGPAHESKVIKEWLVTKRQKVVLASLSSKSAHSISELRPTLFAGEHIIKLTGKKYYEELYRRLDDIPDIILDSVAEQTITLGYKS